MSSRASRASIILSKRPVFSEPFAQSMGQVVDTQSEVHEYMHGLLTLLQGCVGLHQLHQGTRRERGGQGICCPCIFFERILNNCKPFDILFLTGHVRS